MWELLALASLTAVATGVGVLPVYWLGRRVEALQPAMWGIVIGVMGVASVQGLLLPGLRDSADAGVFAGLAIGALFLIGVRTAIGDRDPATHVVSRGGVLVFVVLFAHSLPEGFALGSAWASETAGLGIFIFAAIAIQNVPEGTAVAIPLRESGTRILRAAWLASLTSAPQPVGAVIAYLLVEQVDAVFGPSFGFAAGAMLALLAVEIIPTVLRSGRLRAAFLAAAASGAASAALAALLGVG